jgi:very-short-patch-repair endonuclease
VPNYRANNSKVDALPRVRTLRLESTDAERALWQVLRGRQLAGAKFRRQHQFGPFILDFYCPAAKLALELDGGQHYSDEGAAKDEARTRFLEANGIRVLRFTNTEVLTQLDSTKEVIHRALRGD